MATKGCMAARAQAVAMLRQRREADALPELIGIWRVWIRTMFPNHVGDLPDEMFRTTGSVEHGSGFGQDPDEVRKQFIEMLETEQEHEGEE